MSDEMSEEAVTRAHIIIYSVLLGALMCPLRPLFADSWISLLSFTYRFSATSVGSKVSAPAASTKKMYFSMVCYHLACTSTGHELIQGVLRKACFGRRDIPESLES